jgi:alkyldihydroxyacetonephosphate synthase
MEGGRLRDELKKLLGPARVSFAPQDLVTYASDMLPATQIDKLGKSLPQVEPVAICFPEDVEEVRLLVQFCCQERIPMVPCGAGSGVCGGTVPPEGGIVIDLKKMNRVLRFDADTGIVEVEPGLVGERLEDWLNARGFTLGHFPSSIACSTMGGYVACRSAGQYSSRYGKIEDMTVGLTVVQGDGTVIDLGILGGGHARDPMLSVVLGSEGTLGVITRIALRVEPLPEAVDFAGFAFVDLEDGIACMRRIMRAGVRPTVLRLYDPLDSLIAGMHTSTASGEDVHRVAARLTGLKGLLAGALTDLNEAGIAVALLNPSVLNRIAELMPARCMMIVGVQGDKATVARQWDEVRSIAQACRGEDLGPEPGYHWFKRRYAISYKQSKIFAAGAFVDTMETACTWDNLVPMYRAVLKAMGKEVFLMAHFSHAYPEGCSIYFTFAGYRPTARAAHSVYKRAWRAGLEAVSRYSGTISHHHGIGLLKRWAMGRECPGGVELFTAFKAVMDPERVLNPGKVYNLD